jgi:hypothetical protein
MPASLQLLMFTRKLDNEFFSLLAALRGEVRKERDAEKSEPGKDSVCLKAGESRGKTERDLPREWDKRADFLTDSLRKDVGLRVRAFNDVEHSGFSSWKRNARGPLPSHCGALKSLAKASAGELSSFHGKSQSRMPRRCFSLPAPLADPKCFQFCLNMQAFRFIASGEFTNVEASVNDILDVEIDHAAADLSASTKHAPDALARIETPRIADHVLPVEIGYSGLWECICS